MKPIYIEDTNIPELELYKEKSEVQLRRINEPNPGVFIAESALVIERALAAGYTPISVLADPSVYKSSPELMDTIELMDNVPIFILPQEQLIEFAGYNITRGILSAMKRTSLPSISDILTTPSIKRIAVLENVVNPTNVGAIFRSAAALFIDALLLTPACSDPLYRRALRVSMGNVFMVPWTYTSKDINSICHEYGFKTASMALNHKSISIEASILKSEPKLALFMGSEGYGLSEKTITESDYVVKIPMAEGVDSLNVAAASALAFWEITR